MKLKDKQQLRQAKTTELAKKIADLGRKHHQTLLGIKAGKEKNLKAAANIRREIAFIKTVLAEKNLSTKQPITKDTKPHQKH